jgi:hypothetical protein
LIHAAFWTETRVTLTSNQTNKAGRRRREGFCALFSSSNKNRAQRSSATCRLEHFLQRSRRFDCTRLLMTAASAIAGLLPILLLRMHGTEIERLLAIVMTGGLKEESKCRYTWKFCPQISPYSCAKAFRSCRPWSCASVLRRTSHWLVRQQTCSTPNCQ